MKMGQDAATKRFNALAGVRGFGDYFEAVQAAIQDGVSMPWRAFGDSERDVHGALDFSYAWVSMPWRAFGDSEALKEISANWRDFLGFNALAGVRGFGGMKGTFQ